MRFPARMSLAAVGACAVVLLAACSSTDTRSAAPAESSPVASASAATDAASAEVTPPVTQSAPGEEAEVSVSAVGSDELVWVDPKHLKEEVLDSPTPFILGFSTQWCGPCKYLPTRLRTVSSLRGPGTFGIGILDAEDKNGGVQFADKLGIEGYPTYVALDHGKEISRFLGAGTPETFSNWVKSINIGDTPTPEPTQTSAAPTPTQPSVPTIDGADAPDIVLRSPKTYILGFTAPWCGPCASVSGNLGLVKKDFSEERYDAGMLDIDASEASSRFASKYGVRSLPTYIAYRDGKEISRLVGLKSPKAFREWVWGL